METIEQSEHLDVLIVGAGLSGIGAGYHLQQKCPGKTHHVGSFRGRCEASNPLIQRLSHGIPGSC